MVVANAGNAVEDEKHLREMAVDFDAKVEPLDRVFLAIQGPDAWAALSRAGIETGSLLFMHGVEPRQNWFMSRSGYTGVQPVECYCHRQPKEQTIAPPPPTKLRGRINTN